MNNFIIYVLLAFSIGQGFWIDYKLTNQTNFSVDWQRLHEDLYEHNYKPGTFGVKE